ncbi:MAG: prolyl oligopeptidase family serine peptidase [Bacteroidota bacterium]
MKDRLHVKKMVQQVVAAALTTLLVSCSQTKQGGQIPAPPPTPVKTVVDEFHSVKVPDDYQYLEFLSDDSVLSWFKEQDEYARGILKRISLRQQLLDRIKELDESVPKISSVQMAGDKVFYLKKEPDEESGNLYYREDIKSPEKLLVNVKSFGGEQDERVYTINGYYPSPDGKLVALTSSPSGSEDDVTYVLNVQTGEVLPDRLEKTGVSLSWLPDSKSFFYTRLRKLGPDDPESEKYLDSKAYLHYVGTSQSMDREILSAQKYGNLNIDRIDFPILVADRKSEVTFGVIAKGVQNEVRIFSASIKETLKERVLWRSVINESDDVTNFSTINGSTLIALTHKGTPNFKLVATSLTKPDLSSATTVLSFEDAVIQSFSVSKNYIIVQSLKDGIGRIHLVDKKDPNKVREIELPVLGLAAIAFADEDAEKFLLILTSWTKAPQYYLYDEVTNTLSITDLQPVGKFDTPADLESREVLVQSHDGEMVPLSIIYKKGIELYGKNPTWLTGYGAYGVSSQPFFNPTRMAWLEKGGVYAVAHVRGGGEKGEAWYRGGYKATKPNTWKDFIACAEYLIENKYTAPAYLAGMGTSAGGILIGRAMTERPDLFAVAIPRVGCMNAVRFEFTENAVNTPEFGTVKDSLEFTYLLEMDAYQKIKEGVTYPATFVTAGMTDSRVSPWQPAKFAARLQAVNKTTKPVILRVEFEGGHGFLAASKTQIQEELADMMAFMLWQMGLAELN